MALFPRTEIVAGFQHFLDIGNGWNMYYSSWHASALPIQPAAWALTGLYAHIATNVRSTWRNGPPQHAIVAAIGQIQIAMICKEQPIPWDFVENFASRMSDMTQAGWTGE